MMWPGTDRPATPIGRMGGLFFQRAPCLFTARYPQRYPRPLAYAQIAVLQAVSARFGQTPLPPKYLKNLNKYGIYRFITHTFAHRAG